MKKDEDFSDIEKFGETSSEIQCQDPWHFKPKEVSDPDLFLKQNPIDNSLQDVKSLLPKNTINYNDSLMNLKDILADIAAGDKAARERPEFSCLNFDAIVKALDWLSQSDMLSDSTRLDLIENGWRLNYRSKPPTPREFLDYSYIGEQANTLYKPVADTFVEAMDPLKPYRTIVLSCHIGWGKSLLTVLTNLYISTLYSLMWNPWKYFGQGPATVYTQTLCAWSQKKGSELLLEPFVQILEQAPYFQKVRRHEDLVEASKHEDTADHICWTTSAMSSALAMQNGVNYKLISEAGGLLGQTIITGSMTELAFFHDQGWSDEKILKFFTKLRQRIDSRMKGNYMGRFIIDSSPNTLESVIDKWIWEDAPKDPKNYIITGSRWKYYPEDFPEYITLNSDGTRTEKNDFVNGFPLFKGGNGQPPQVVETENQLKQYVNTDIIWCPTKQITKSGVVNFKDSAKENPIEFMRDWCGIPSGAAERIFYDPNVIDHAFDNELKNIYSSIAAPKEEEPEHLIWDKVKDKFFNKIIDKYYFYYEPELPRVASVDLAISGDTACIALSHVERDATRVDSQGNPLKVYVTDMTVNVTPKGGIINLDAFKFFIMDLKTLGNMNIRHVSFDGFQSRSIMQALERFGCEVDLLSVDKQNAPYLSYIDYVFHKRWYCGKNIFVKNNMLAIQMVKRQQTGTTKIDHTKGDNVYTDQFCGIGTDYTEQSWSLSRCGVNAKDSLDAIAANLNLLDTYSTEFLPIHVFEPHKKLERTYETARADVSSMLEMMGLKT